MFELSKSVSTNREVTYDEFCKAIMEFTKQMSTFKDHIPKAGDVNRGVRSLGDITERKKSPEISWWRGSVSRQSRQVILKYVLQPILGNAKFLSDYSIMPCSERRW